MIVGVDANLKFQFLFIKSRVENFKYIIICCLNLYAWFLVFERRCMHVVVSEDIL